MDGDLQVMGSIGHFDGNDSLDVGSVSRSIQQLAAFRGDGTGLFHDGVAVDDPNTDVRRVAAGAVDEDGLDDLVIARGANAPGIRVDLSDPRRAASRRASGVHGPPRAHRDPTVVRQALRRTGRPRCRARSGLLASNTSTDFPLT